MMDFELWLAYGQERGWVSEPKCLSHDGIPLTDEEEAEYDEYDDPCIGIVRVMPPA